MPTLLHADVGLVKGIQFHSWRRVGSAMQAVRVYNMREVDEMVLLDITATRQGRGPDVEVLRELAKECFVPLTAGGGVRSLEHVRSLLSAGADKVVLNTAAVEMPTLISEIATMFGSQCVVVSIDAARDADGRLEVVTNSGTKRTGRDPVSVAMEAELLGAGELLITSIDRDGTMEGYDLELTRDVAHHVQIPVIASGGAGEYGHMVSALREGGAAAVAAASIFHFTHQTPLDAKRHLAGQGFPVRI